MSALQNISKIEYSLWEAADQLRANSTLTSSEYCTPVLGVIFLRPTFTIRSPGCKTASSRSKCRTCPSCARSSAAPRSKPPTGLTPGRYVGVAPAEVDEDFDFKQTRRDIHVELADLKREAVELAARLQENFEELGV